MIAIVAKMNLERALALQSLQLQGYSVLAVINSDDDEHFHHAAGVLSNHGIASTHLKNIASVSQICRRQLAGSR
ncbi:MAG: hypothetical protein R3C03_12730 [Pirellulaceae bacterium]